MELVAGNGSLIPIDLEKFFNISADFAYVSVVDEARAELSNEDAHATREATRC